MDSIKTKCNTLLVEWLNTCTRNGKISRNTVAIGIVVLDHLKKNGIVNRDDVISQGGEISGARSGLGRILESYDIPRNYLKEITTRQAHQDGQHLFEKFEWGKIFNNTEEIDREEIITSLISVLQKEANDWLKKQNLKLNIDRRQAPSSWINEIVENAEGRSGGIVEQHLVGAKLARRFHNISITNHPAHAADVQTDRKGDFAIAKMIYHVTASPSKNVINKCKENIQIGLSPILLVPTKQETRARILAEDEGILKEITIISIESFVSLNIIEMATEENKDFYTLLKEIIDIYNQRLSEAETDMSLQIEIT